jgi:hypothetical protein
VWGGGGGWLSLNHSLVVMRLFLSHFENGKMPTVDNSLFTSVLRAAFCRDCSKLRSTQPNKNTVATAKHSSPPALSPTPERQTAETQGRTYGPIERGWIDVERGEPRGLRGKAGRVTHSTSGSPKVCPLPLPTPPKELAFFFPLPATKPKDFPSFHYKQLKRPFARKMKPQGICYTQHMPESHF